MFSATGKILPGSIDHPAMATIINSCRGYDADTQVCRWNNLGYIPIVSTLTGCARALLGIIHAIVHLVSAIFDSKNSAHHLQEAKLGGYNIGRGLVEIIPLLGNIILFVKDTITATKQNDLALKYKNTHKEECSKHVLLFVDGNIVGKKSFIEIYMHGLAEGIKEKPSFWKEVEMVQKQNTTQPGF